MDSLMDDLDDYPWLDGVLGEALPADGALHHGLLLTGLSGIAKRELAMEFARSLLCSVSTGHAAACGECQDCRLFPAGSHPDFHVLTTELEALHGRMSLLGTYGDRYQDLAAREKRTNPSRVIAVDAVRRLIDSFSVSAQIARRKIALVLPADRMNVNAANALLKLLEEPPADAVLILVTDSPAYLPATIRSRCLRIALPAPTSDVAGTWLQERLGQLPGELPVGVGPLDALAWFSSDFFEQASRLERAIEGLGAGRQSPIDLAADLGKHDFSTVIDWLHRYCSQRIRAASEGHRPRAGKSIEKLFLLYDKIGQYRKIARDQLNEQLALEELVLTLQHTLRD